MITVASRFTTEKAAREWIKHWEMASYVQLALELERLRRGKAA